MPRFFLSVNNDGLGYSLRFNAKLLKPFDESLWSFKVRILVTILMTLFILFHCSALTNETTLDFSLSFWTQIRFFKTRLKCKFILEPA